MQSTRPASIIFRRMSPSPPDREDREPLASTMPMRPPGARCQIMCWSQAKLAFPAGGIPYGHRTSPRSLSAPQSERLKGGFAMMKSALSWGWRSSKKVSALNLPWSASMPRIARFIWASFQVVGLESWP